MLLHLVVHWLYDSQLSVTDNSGDTEANKTHVNLWLIPGGTEAMLQPPEFIADT